MPTAQEQTQLPNPFSPEALEFIPYGGACGDFLIFCGENPALDARLRALGARVEARPGHTVYSWGMPEGRWILSGTGIIDGRMLLGPQSLDRAPRETGAGLYNLLGFEEGHTSIRLDPTGHHKVYYGRNLATNRLHLAALATGRLDVAGAFANASFNSVFCHQLSTIRTPVAGVEVLLGGERLEIDSSVHLHDPIGSIDFPEELTPDEYRALIRKGAEEITANVAAALDSGRPVICDLSGGRDSRIVLAAIVALGRIKDVVFNTKVTPNKLGDVDVAIATGLVREFGGSYFPKLPVSGWDATTIRQRLLMRRSHLFGAYHFFPKAQLNTVTNRSERRAVRLQGGAGEIYRDIFQKFFQLQDRRQPYEAHTMLRLLAAREAWPEVPEILDTAQAHYLDTFERLPGRTISQKLDSHYFFFRNGYHYGVKIPKRGAAEDFNPGYSPALMQATRGLPPEVKATGRVVFDITRELCEKLAYIQYDKPWEVDFTASEYHTPSRLDGQIFDVTPAPELLKRPAGDVPPHPRGSRPKAEPVDFKAICWEMFEENFNRLKARDGALSAYASERIYALARADWEKMNPNRAGINRVGSFASRLQAFNDFLTLMEPPA